MTGLCCVSVAGCRAPLALLERLSYPPAELTGRLPGLRERAGASAVAVLSTCQRVEAYATRVPDAGALLAALAADRGVPVPELAAAAGVHEGPGAVRHLMRVATGLESFVLGESEIVGQVRAAAAAARAAGTGGPELDRLLADAVDASRRVHRTVALAGAAPSVAAAAVDAVARWSGGSLAGRRVLVVGAGLVAGAVVARAVALGAEVTVCNRTRRRADRLAAAGATVVDLAELPARLADADVAILGTAAPHPLVDAGTLRAAGDRPPLLVDLCLPRNVDPAVRALPGVRLVDLVDLRAAGTGAAGAFVGDVERATEVVEDAVARHLRRSAGRAAAAAVRRLRADAEAVARAELARHPGPDERLERAVRRVVNRLLHGPTRALSAAAETGDPELVALLSGLFAGSARPQAHAATRLRGSALDAHRPHPGTGEQALDECAGHAAHQIAV